MTKWFNRNKLLLLIVLGLIVFGTSTFVSQQIQIKQLNAERLGYIAKIERLKLVKQNLQEELERSGSLEYIEIVAREKYNMVKPDEILFFINH